MWIGSDTTIVAAAYSSDSTHTEKELDMGQVLTIGEAMGLLIANRPGDLAEVEQFSRHVCGAELNYAVGMARLGHDVFYISKVGRDPFGNSICRFLRENCVHTDYIGMDEEHMTGFQMKEMVREGDPAVANIRKYTAFSFMTPDDVQSICWDGVTHLHATGIPLAVSASCRQTVVALMQEARRRGVSVSFDTNLRPMLWPDQETMAQAINDAAQYADIVMPGLSEGQILTGLETEKDIARYYLEHGATLVVVKLGGSDGAYVCSRERDVYVPSYRVDHVVDTVGAGDGFAVGFTSAWLEGLSLEEAARRGAAIGAMVIQVAGDNEGLPTREQLRAFQQAPASCGSRYL